MLQRPQAALPAIPAGDAAGSHHPGDGLVLPVGGMLENVFIAWGSDLANPQPPMVRVSHARTPVEMPLGTPLFGPMLPRERGEMGAGPPPIRTHRGWLVIYNVTDGAAHFHVGAKELALDDLTKVIGEVPYPLLSPEDHDEIVGDACPNVVFCNGAFLDGDRLTLAFGKGDRSIGFATCSLQQLLRDGMRPPATSPPLPTFWRVNRTPEKSL